MYTVETDSLSDHLKAIANWLAGRELTSNLAYELANEFPPLGDVFDAVERNAISAIDAGRIGKSADSSTVYARLFEPGEPTRGFSIDIVKLTNVVGGRHVHPRGEVDMIIPLSPGARFNNHEKGWLTLPPGSAHRPIARGGSVIVIYFLPGGEMRF